MSKNYKESSKVSYKPAIKANSILELQKQNPDMTYAAVRIDEAYDPDGERIQEYFDNNWEYAVLEGRVESDYDSTKSREGLENNKPTRITKKGKGGAVFVYLCKTKEQQLKDEKARVQREKDAFDISQGRKVTRQGSNVTITDPEANA